MSDMGSRRKGKAMEPHACPENTGVEPGTVTEKKLEQDDQG